MVLKDTPQILGASLHQLLEVGLAMTLVLRPRARIGAGASGGDGLEIPKSPSICAWRGMTQGYTKVAYRMSVRLLDAPTLRQRWDSEHMFGTLPTGWWLKG